jgi:Bacterial PH domain
VVTELQWRVDRKMTILKAAGAAVFAVAAVLLDDDPAGLVLGLIAACVLAGFALRDVLAPVRLAADAAGITVVTGFSGRRHIPWSDVERVRVDTQRRLGRQLEFLEIDTGETLHLFSSAELGADLGEVATALATLRTGR